MALIRIEEKPSLGADGTNATLSFEHEDSKYHITVIDPFTEKEEQELEWYFEEHLRFPFTKQVQAQKAATSITTYGEALFEQVFVHLEFYAKYQKIRASDLSDLQIEIIGSPQFHSLHWEALKDPALIEPLALQALIVRKNLQSQNLPLPLHHSPTINLLIVTARPFGKGDIGYRTISRPLIEALHRTNLPIQIDILRPGTYRALENHLLEITGKHGEGYYNAIHFDTHGKVYKNEAFLFFEDEQDNGFRRIKATVLADLLQSHQVPIVILNACQSGKQVGDSESSLGSRLIQEGVQLVLAMGYSVTISAAELLMSTLYSQLFNGNDLRFAIRHARMKLYSYKERKAYFNQKIDLEDWLLPVVYQNNPVQLQTREFTPKERAAWEEYKAEERRYTLPDPTYGFVGRDLDILQIEKRLLTKGNMLLIRGMGGAGKTTLLRHLGTWWHATGFVQRVFYFGYDEKAWTCQQIMMEIAQQLYGSRYYTDYQPRTPEDQQAILAHDLRTNNHLLILDHLESITGTHLTIQHTLSKGEQDALRGFLNTLAVTNFTSTSHAKKHTLVLLCSRGSVDCLAKGTFEDNVYNLDGLDKEATSKLAECILERNHATQYRDAEAFRTLFNALEGFPLAMEVVLANLSKQTPQEVLIALHAGDVKIDKGTSDSEKKNIFEQKTESILCCIDYSYSNLSPEAQQMLLCLAPFTLVFDLHLLEGYTTLLRREPALATLQVERWPEILKEAINWGLLSPDPEIPFILHLQPIFPYFLRNRLRTPEQAPIRCAMETAFLETYDRSSFIIEKLLNSEDRHERIAGQVLAQLEYENLVMALNLALETQVSFGNPPNLLIEYIERTHELRRGLTLFQGFLDRLEQYPKDKLNGRLGVELAILISKIAGWQLELRQYEGVEASCKKLLKVLLQVEQMDEKEKNLLTAIAYSQLGNAAREQRQWQQAEQYFKQAEPIFKGSNDRHMLAGLYHNLGIVAQGQQQWQQAEQYFQRAEQIKIELNDRYSLAKTYFELGNLVQEQQQWQQAEQYFQRAKQIFIEFNDRYSLAKTYVVMANVAQGQQQWQQAEQYYQQALPIFIEFNDSYSTVVIYYNLGNVTLEQQQWQQAEQYYQQALTIFIKSNDYYAQTGIYHKLGIIAQKRLQWQKARDYLLRALETYMAFEDGDQRILVLILRSLAAQWKKNADESIPTAIATLMGYTLIEVEKILHLAIQYNLYSSPAHLYLD